MEEQSLAMSLIEVLKAQNKRQFIVLVIIILCWLLTIIGFVGYINQFDYSTESTATFETDNSGTINTGDIDNG